MSFEFAKFIHRETEGPKVSILLLSLTSGLSRGLLLAIINAAAAKSLTGDNILLYITGFIFFLVLYISSNLYVEVGATKIIEKARKNITLRLCKKLLKIELHFIESTGQGELFERLKLDVKTVCDIATTVLKASQASILLFFCLAYIAWLSPIAMFITIVTIIIGVSVYLLQDKKVTDHLRKARASAVNITDRINDLLKGFKELKINRKKSGDLTNHLEEISGDYKNQNIKVAFLQSTTYLTTQALIFILIAVVIFIIPQFVSLSSTVIFQFFASILFLIGPLEILVSSMQDITKANVALENINKLEKNLDESIKLLKSDRDKLETFLFNNIEFVDICFQYKQTHTDDTFKIGPVNMRINKGEILFIVGGNGTGKTTLLKILTGLYIPTSGTIKINDQPLLMENYQSYREMFTAILADFHIFKQLYGLENLDNQKLLDLLVSLYIDSKTHIENNQFTSINLSTGQRKRLAYAVSYLENKQIFVFDEFGADQDPVFKKYFYFTLLPKLKQEGKTVIIATHDENYFSACDRIIKMDYGMIVDYKN